MSDLDLRTRIKALYRAAAVAEAGGGREMALLFLLEEAERAFLEAHYSEEDLSKLKKDVDAELELERRAKIGEYTAREKLDVSVQSVWDGLSGDTGQIATYRLLFPEFAAEKIRPVKSLRDFKAVSEVHRVLEGQLQALARRRFGDEYVTLSLRGTRLGSLETWASLSTIGGVLLFFKNYEDVRKGALTFAADIRSAANELNDLAIRTYVWCQTNLALLDSSPPPANDSDLSE